MKCEYLSASGASLYEQCPYRFYNKYELGNRGSAATSQIGAGLLSHKALELYYGTKYNLNAEEAFTKAAQEQECANQQAFEEARQMFFAQTILEPRESVDVIDSEMAFKLFLESGASARGYIDRVDLIDRRTLRIVDYKSGMFIPTMDEIESSHQTQLYSAYFFRNPIFDKFDTIIVNYKYIRANKQKTVFVYRDNIEKYIQYFDHLFHAILRNDSPKPCLNSFCWNCECRSQCSEYSNFITIVAMMGSAVGLLNPKITKIDEVKDLSPQEVIQIFDAMSNVCTCLDKEKKNLSSWVVGLIGAHSDGAIDTGDGRIATLTSRKNLRVNSKHAGRELIKKHNLIEEALAMLKATDIEKLVGSSKAAMEDFEQIAVEDDGNPYPTIKKAKGKK